MIRMAAALGLVVCGTVPAQAQKVSLLLDWAWIPYHTVFLVAQDRGFYKEAGLDVTIEQGRGSATTTVVVTTVVEATSTTGAAPEATTTIVPPASSSSVVTTSSVPNTPVPTVTQPAIVGTDVHLPTTTSAVVDGGPPPVP